VRAAFNLLKCGVWIDWPYYSRPWFAWANSYFAEMMLDLAERKPHLIFKENKPYIPGKN
jgi:meiotically up-regulated gene 157 (Mug157) protein